MDCDMLCLGDVAELSNYMTLSNFYSYAVRVVKHDYQVKEAVKFLGNVQTKYERKNWSSMMIFNNRLCEKLTLDYVNKAHGLDMHQFKWVDDDKIAGLPKEWNWLVGEEGYESGSPKLIHYTKGTPCFPEYAHQDFAELWHAEREDMMSHA